MGREVPVNIEVVDQFPVYDTDGYTRISGMVQGDFTIIVYYNGVVQVAYPVTITEISSGEYKTTFTPNAVGFWVVVIGTSAYLQWREGEYDVVEASPINDLYAMVKRVLGLTHENMRIDETSYDADGQLTSARIRLFNDSADALASTEGGTSPPDPVPLATYTYTAVWEGINKYKTFLQVLEP